MTYREALVAGVWARPADDTRRLALADWLDEHADPARAEFVRCQVEAARLPVRHPRRWPLLRRADELECRHDRDWLGPWADRLIDWQFRRGFLWSVKLTAAEFLRSADELFRAEPVQQVELVGDDGKGLPADAVREVVAHPAFARIRDRWSLSAGGRGSWCRGCWPTRT